MSATDLARHFETCRLVGYLDTGGTPTNGWGHTGKDVYVGQVWTQIYADTELVHDEYCAKTQLLAYSPSVASLPGPLAALTDFVYNLGIGAYRTSTLCKMVNAGNWPAAKVQIELWDHGKVNGDEVVLRGLTLRRQAEAALL